MGENSKIAWTHHTFNPWIGCQRVSPGCEHCYAEAYDKRVGGGLDPADQMKKLRWGPTAPRVRTSAANWKKPLAWNKAAAAAGERHRVFCSSLADVFEDRPELVQWRAELFALISRTRNLDWLLLTKRPENIARLWPFVIDEYLPTTEMKARSSSTTTAIGPENWPNVWLGTTVEDQQRANERIPKLLEMPAAVHFLSCEPLLEAIDIFTPALKSAEKWAFEPNMHHHTIGWIIVGGESGPAARPFDVAWARSLRTQVHRHFKAAHFFVKQLGSRPRGFCSTACEYPDEELPNDFCDIYEASEGPHCGDTCQIRLADSHGGDPEEWPLDLRIREFPTPRAV